MRKIVLLAAVVAGISEWTHNVLAAGRCRLLLGDETLELHEPILEAPADVPGLAAPVRALFEWLGFRYLRLSVAAPSSTDAPAPILEALPA